MVVWNLVDVSVSSWIYQSKWLFEISLTTSHSFYRHIIKAFFLWNGWIRNKKKIFTLSREAIINYSKAKDYAVFLEPWLGSCLSGTVFSQDWLITFPDFCMKLLKMIHNRAYKYIKVRQLILWGKFLLCPKWSNYGVL